MQFTKICVFYMNKQEKKTRYLVMSHSDLLGFRLTGNRLKISLRRVTGVNTPSNLCICNCCMHFQKTLTKQNCNYIEFYKFCNTVYCKMYRREPYRKSPRFTLAVEKPYRENITVEPCMITR